MSRITLYLVSVAPNPSAHAVIWARKAQDKPSPKGRDFRALGAAWTPRAEKTSCQKTLSFLTGFLSPPAETIQNWGIWSEQGGWIHAVWEEMTRSGW